MSAALNLVAQVPLMLAETANLRPLATGDDHQANGLRRLVRERDEDPAVTDGLGRWRPGQPLCNDERSSTACR